MGCKSDYNVIYDAPSGLTTLTQATIPLKPRIIIFTIYCLGLGGLIARWNNSLELFIL